MPLNCIFIIKSWYTVIMYISMKTIQQKHCNFSIVLLAMHLIKEDMHKCSWWSTSCNDTIKYDLPASLPHCQIHWLRGFLHNNVDVYFMSLVKSQYIPHSIKGKHTTITLHLKRLIQQIQYYQQWVTLWKTVKNAPDKHFMWHASKNKYIQARKWMLILTH